GLVPFKWMALESIRDSLFTEKSDVWSFGILLWEIFSLGATPYPGMYFNDVHQYLLQGKRMDPPIQCPEDINDVMSMCCKENPEDRPNFHSLKDLLYEILDCKEIPQTSAYNKDIVNVPLKSNVIASEEDVSENELFL
ncbi:partial, partial [Paramuricea clavata]